MWLLRPRSVREVVYVPVTLADSRPAAEKWSDEQYLQSVKAFAVNPVFMGEVLAELSALRDQADSAATPDELKGYRKGIEALKRLLTVGARAAEVIRARRELEKMNAGAE